MPSESSAAQPLNQASIVDAALRIVEADGMAGLSMRRVARELERAPMSLYRHVADLDALLALVVDELTSTVSVVDHGQDWRATLRGAAEQLHAVFLRYPGITTVVMATGLRTEGMLRTLDTVISAMLRAGLTPQQAARTHRALFSLIFGDSVMQRAAGDSIAASPESWQRFFAGLLGAGGATFPSLAAVAPSIVQLGPHEGFEFALERLLDGIAALAAETDRERATTG